MDGWSTVKMAAQLVVMIIFILTIIDIVLAQHDGDLQLMTGDTPRSGRLEVYRSNQWVPIYDGGGFGLREAVVACRQLGYSTDAVQVFHGGVFGSGTSSTRLTDVNCVGGEMRLMECSFTVCGTGDCSHDNDVGISCERNEHDRYIPSQPSYRRWSVFVVVLIMVPFCGHAYKRRSRYGHQSRSIIPIPRYHHGRVPLTSALDDTTMSSSSGSPTQSYHNSSQCVPSEPLPRVYTEGYRARGYPPTSTSLRPTASVQPTPVAVDAPNVSLGPSQYSSNQYPTCARPQGIYPSADFTSVPPPEYSELDEIVMPNETIHHDSTPILGPPPPYEDIVKT